MITSILLAVSVPVVTAVLGFITCTMLESVL